MKSRVYLLIAVGVGLVFIVLLGALVLREKEHEMQIASVATKQDDKTQQEAIPQKTTEDQAEKQWRTYRNDAYGFELQYPSTYLFDENLVQGPEYSINFGIPVKEISGKSSQRKAVRSFEISIYKNENGVDSLIKKENAARGAVEQSSEVIGTEKVANTLAKIIKACDIGGNCNKIVYFSHSKLTYSIYMRNYFSTTEIENKSDADVMLSSFQVE